jgi:uncharacterized protein DUF3892
MAITVQIACVNKSNGIEPHERIQSVGGATGTQRWKMTQLDAIGAIRRGEYQFSISVDGRSIRVLVAKSPSGNAYLKAETDGEQPNSLLSLPECPP